MSLRVNLSLRPLYSPLLHLHLLHTPELIFFLFLFYFYSESAGQSPVVPKTIVDLQGPAFAALVELRKTCAVSVCLLVCRYQHHFLFMISILLSIIFYLYFSLLFNTNRLLLYLLLLLRCQIAVNCLPWMY